MEAVENIAEVEGGEVLPWKSRPWWFIPCYSQGTIAEISLFREAKTWGAGAREESDGMGWNLIRG